MTSSARDLWPYLLLSDHATLTSESEDDKMMFYGSGGWNPWTLAPMIIVMLLFWGFVMWGGLWLFRGSRSRNCGSARLDSGQILNERLARGKTSPEEYDRLQKLIEPTS